MSGFFELEKEFEGLVSCSRGRGLHLAFDANSTQNRDFIVKTAFDEGLLIGGSGDKSIRMRPALNLSEDEAYKVLDVLRKVLKEIK